MTNYFVGQRVRINCPESNGHGHEAFIRALNVNGLDYSGRKFKGAEIDLKAKNRKYQYAVFEYHELEPILPEGSAPSEYSFSELMDSLRETVK